MRLLTRSLLVPALAAVAVATCGATTYLVTPGSAWCGVVNAAAPGDTVVFTAGSYPQTCSITKSGTAGAPITLRSQSGAPADRAFFTYAGTSSNIVDVYGSYLVFRWLTFGPTAAGVNPLKLRSSISGVVVDQNFFDRTDIAVAANSPGSVYQNISVTNNLLSNLKSTGLYFGCHDGVSCHALNILIRGNTIRTVQPGDGVGYGLEIKLNSWATILENTIYDSQGPGIDVYGSNRGDPASIVERNYVEGSKNDAGINISGGPAIVRNNIVVANRYNGIWAQDYGGRGLQHNVWIVHNTALANQTGGIQVSNWVSGAGNVLAFNAIAPLTGTPAVIPASPVANPVIGNQTCSPATSCFARPLTAPYDLWPLSGGLLIGAAGAGTEPWRPGDDFMCVGRWPAADVGAMQRTAPGPGPLVGGGTTRPPCSSAPTPTATAVPPTATSTPTPTRSFSPTPTLTKTLSATATPTPTTTRTKTSTPSITPIRTPTATVTRTPTPPPTPTPTPTLVATPTGTPTLLLSSITPRAGSAAGGNPFIVNGTGFLAGATVDLGGRPAPAVTVVSGSRIDALAPALLPGTLNRLVVTNPNVSFGVLGNAWLADFLDVPRESSVHPFVEKLVRDSVTVGCGGGNFCPASAVTRAQMAVFLLRSEDGPTYAPPACSVPVFADVPCSSPFAPWIDELAARGVTVGCGGGKYCPNDPVTRAQIAVLLLRTHDGAGYTPPPCVAPTFTDVPCSSPFAVWVDELAARGITVGCGGGDYCPNAFVTRGQMAVFLVKTFALP